MGVTRLKYKLVLPIIAAIAAIAVFGFSPSSVDYADKHADVTTQTTASMATFIPGVTDVQVGSHSTYLTSDIGDVRSDVFATVLGTVTEFGKPIVWTDPVPRDEIPGYEEVYGKDVYVPIHIKVLDAKKHNIAKGDKITVNLVGKLLGDTLYLDENDPHFAVGETVVVHVGKDVSNVITSDFNFVKLGKFGKYQVVDDKAYNEKHPQGKLLDTVINEAK